MQSSNAERERSVAAARILHRLSLWTCLWTCPASFCFIRPRCLLNLNAEPVMGHHTSIGPIPPRRVTWRAPVHYAIDDAAIGGCRGEHLYNVGLMTWRAPVQYVVDDAAHTRIRSASNPVSISFVYCNALITVSIGYSESYSPPTPPLLSFHLQKISGDHTTSPVSYL